MRLFQVCSVSASFFILSAIGGLGCGSSEVQPTEQSKTNCSTPLPLATVGKLGQANVFLSDPISSSSQLELTPLFRHLDQFLKPVNLERLTGEGVLRGEWVQVVNGLDCQEQFNAFSRDNEFVYSHKDHRFQEAMTYFFADQYQHKIQKLGYLSISAPVSLVVHCDELDNAYFERHESLAGVFVNRVCLGDSSQIQGASYSDDGLVTIHELQHANTLNNYSPTQDLNQLWYDEAGALNEGISDFMGLVFADQMNPNKNIDPRVFSRWALGKFDPQRSHARGAHRCPEYDSSFPTCAGYPHFEFPSQKNDSRTTISLVYPDGLGWPYTQFYYGNPSARKIYEKYSMKEEIHDAGVMIEGALWDAYAALQVNHPDPSTFAAEAMTQLVMESVRHLPQPNLSTNASPVTFIGFASSLATYSEQLKGLTESDRSLIRQALKERGLYDYTPIAKIDWLAKGSGTNQNIPETETPGVRIVDNPTVLKKWLNGFQGNVKILDSENLSLNSIPNSQLDPGEVAAIWFDLQNNSETTAGGVMVTVSSNDPDVVILNGSVNRGYLSANTENKTQIIYAKINGTHIVEALNPNHSDENSLIGNSYFKSLPQFDKNGTTAVWVKVLASAPHGKIIYFNVTAQPSNGVPSSEVFPVTIH